MKERQHPYVNTLRLKNTDELEFKSSIQEVNASHVQKHYAKLKTMEAKYEQSVKGNMVRLVAEKEACQSH